jgi:hypothetical protein
MIPLAGRSVPASSAELCTALREGLAAQGASVEVSATGAWPNLDLLAINLLKVEKPKPLAKGEGEEGRLTVARLELAGTPATVEGIPITLRAEVTGVDATFATTSDGQKQLVAKAAAGGALHLEAQTKEIEAAVHQIVSSLASKQGVTVKQTQLVLRSPSPRTVDFDVTCDAKVFIASASITVTGSLEIDDQLNATARGLRVIGDGMIVNMARGILEPRLAEYNGKVIPLGSFVAAGLAVKDLRVATGDALTIDATFAPRG